MYIDVNNLNDNIRDFIIKNLYADFYNKQDCEDRIELLSGIKENDFEFYKTLIGVMYCDFCDIYIFYNELYNDQNTKTFIPEEKEEYCNEEYDFIDEEEWEDEQEYEEYNDKLKLAAQELLLLNNINEVIEYIDKDKTILIPFIESARDITCMFTDEKRNLYNREISIHKNLNKIYPLHILDILAYTKKLTKEDLIILQRNYYETIDTLDDEELKEQEFYDSSINFVADTLIDEYDFDCYNYKTLLLDIISDYYDYSKFLICNNVNGSEKIDKKLLKFIETKSLDEIVNETLQNKISLNEIIEYFIEYNYKTSKQKKVIIKNIKSKKVKDIRVKILLKKRRQN